MKNITRLLLGGLGLWAAATTAPGQSNHPASPSSAQAAPGPYEILTIGGTNGPGSHPATGVVRGSDGNYYGTAPIGGALGGGTVFKLTPAGVLSRLVSFPRAEGFPREALIMASDGNLYGTTEGGPSDAPNSTGTIFRVSLAGKLTILAKFVNTGEQPVAPQRLVEASDGNFYGTTTAGGAQNAGSIFRLKPDGTLTTLASFTADSTDSGAHPMAGLIEGTDGHLYGTTSGGGTFYNGTVFRVTKSGVVTVLASFDTDSATGFSPQAELTQGPAGDFYGVTSSSSNNVGALFRITATGTLTAFAELPSGLFSNNASSPLLLAENGNFYGTTYDYFYQVTPSGVVTVLSRFTHFDPTHQDERAASGPLLDLGGGQFLGTTISGLIGRSQYSSGQKEFGTVHRLTDKGESPTVAAFPDVSGTGFNSELSEGADGKLYGTLSGSGLEAFKISKSGVLNTLLDFGTPQESGKSSRLVRVANGDLVGTVASGDLHFDSPSPYPGNYSGLIYSITPAGVVHSLYTFPRTDTPGSAPNEHGETPTGGLAAGPDAYLYGTTQFGGTNAKGTFFKINTDGNLTTLASFNATTGFEPTGDLIFDGAVFYGVTSAGGDNGTGTFFTVTPEGQVTRVTSLPAGQHLTTNSRLTLANNGNFYGTFATGGAHGMGRVFRISKTGVLTLLASMDANTGANPLGIIQASDGNFYGVTSPSGAPGSIFRINPAGSVTVVARFSDENGTSPKANLMQASDGHLYGTTFEGGPSGRGVIYRVKLPSKRLLNISTRGRVQSGENVLIGGFIISGNVPKKVIVRAIGPSLQAHGVEDALPNPVVELRGADGAFIARNDDWKETQKADIETSGLPPSNDLESAIVATLNPGNYTAIVSGKNSIAGVGLVEVYDLGSTADSKLVNISTRGFVETGENVMIGGFIVGADGASSNTIIRAVGPSLQASGVSGALADPTLELRNGNGDLIVANDDWKDDPAQAAQIQASGIPPQNDHESAIATMLPSGPTTVIVRGKGEGTGVGLIEVYNVQ